MCVYKHGQDSVQDRAPAVGMSLAAVFCISGQWKSMQHFAECHKIFHQTVFLLEIPNTFIISGKKDDILQNWALNFYLTDFYKIAIFEPAKRFDSPKFQFLANA